MKSGLEYRSVCFVKRTYQFWHQNWEWALNRVWAFIGFNMVSGILQLRYLFQTEYMDKNTFPMLDLDADVEDYEVKRD